MRNVMAQKRDMIREKPIDVEDMKCVEQWDVEENVVVTTVFISFAVAMQT